MYRSESGTGSRSKIHPPEQIKNPSRVISWLPNNDHNAAVTVTTQIKDDFGQVLAAGLRLLSGRWRLA